MGKKQIAVLAKMKPLFITQAVERGHAAEPLEKIWKDWEAFASYAFNKSHSTCYAWIAYQTAYLKAHYPAEYMAAVLSNNLSDIKQVAFFMEECKRAGITVLGPDVNESYLKFSVNEDGAIRFGMAAIKGVGGNAVEEIIRERKENGKFTSIFDVVKRIDLRIAGKKAVEGLILAGGFDSFEGTHRAQYYVQDEKGSSFLEKALKFGNKYQESQNSSQVSLFGEASEITFPEPNIPGCETWGTMELLAREKEVTGMYISAHPLDDFKNEMRFCNTKLSAFKGDMSNYLGHKLSIGAIVSTVEHRVSKMGKGWATFVIEDYGDSHEFRIFGNEYLQFRPFLTENTFLYVNAILQPGWPNKETGIQGEPRLKFTNFMLLHDVMDEKCEKITIQLNMNEVTEEYVRHIHSVLSDYSIAGKQKLNFSLREQREKIELTMPSRSMKINASPEFFTRMEKENIRYKIN